MVDDDACDDEVGGFETSAQQQQQNIYIIITHFIVFQHLNAHHMRQKEVSHFPI